MKLRYLMTTLLLCGPALVAAADNTGWQDARTPGATTAAAPQGQKRKQQVYRQPGLVESSRPGTKLAAGR